MASLGGQEGKDPSATSMPGLRTLEAVGAESPNMTAGCVGDFREVEYCTAHQRPLATCTALAARDARVGEKWLNMLDQADKITNEFYGPGETRTIRRSVTDWLRAQAALLAVEGGVDQMARDNAEVLGIVNPSSRPAARVARISRSGDIVDHS